MITLTSFMKTPASILLNPTDPIQRIGSIDTTPEEYIKAFKNLGKQILTVYICNGDLHVLFSETNYDVIEGEFVHLRAIKEALKAYVYDPNDPKIVNDISYILPS